MTLRHYSAGAPVGFKTDTDISGNTSGRERELQRWDASADTAVDLSFSDKDRNWDQFAVNERLYGVKSDYDETLYTTAIDRTAPDYKKRAAAADRIAREIESTPTTNVHLAEERGQISQTDGLDEEDRCDPAVS